jgi:hypothetical protein
MTTRMVFQRAAYGCFLLSNIGLEFPVRDAHYCIGGQGTSILWIMNLEAM